MNWLPQQGEADAVDDLRRVLHGVLRLDLNHGSVRVRIGPLPDHLIAAGAVEDGHTWLFIDREKPGAMGHARELVSEYPELLDDANGVTREALWADEDVVAELILRRA